MFGFLQPTTHNQMYRQVYAGLCERQRLTGGFWAIPFISYEAVFLYLVAAESGVVAAPRSSAPTCCKLGWTRSRDWRIDPEIGDLCVSIGLILAQIKLQDDVIDDRSMIAKFLLRRMKGPMSRAWQMLETVQPGVREQATKVVDDHNAAERENGFDSLEDFGRPTADGFELLFSAFDLLCKRRNPDWPGISKVGRELGAAIVLADCCFDRKSDIATGRFNPLKSDSDRDLARQMALSHLSQAGWHCVDLMGSESRSAEIFKSAFQRVRRIESINSKNNNKSSRNNIAAFSALRRGECDVCLVCEAPNAICGGCEVCCATPQALCERRCTRCGDLCDRRCDRCCNSCLCQPHVEPQREPDPPYAVIVNTPQKNNKENETPPEPQKKPKHLMSVGLAGRLAKAITTLAPGGVVSIEGFEIPARCSSGVVQAGSNVTVLEQNSFGLIVCEV